MKFEPVTLESLRSDKAFAKATKKHQKDLETMRKRQQKEKATVQKNQVAAVERIVKGKKYFILMLIPIRDFHSLWFAYSKDEFINDPALKQLVAEQAKEWSELVGRHLKEEWTLLKEQLEAQQDILKTVMMGAQGAQLKLLDAKLEK